LEGSDWINSEESGMSAKNMGQRFIDSIDNTLKNYSPKTDITLWKI